MKKALTLLLALLLVLALVGCAGNEPAVTPTPAPTPAPATAAPATAAPETAAPVEPVAPAVMSYAEYVAAPLDSQVVVETYVQAKQSWWDNKATVYTQDENGAYFLYNMACAEEDYAKLIPGAKIRVTGYKSEWSGEVEITDGTFELLEGSYIAPAVDMTALLGTDELILHQNEFVAFKGMTVAPSKDADGNDVAFLYNWDGSGQDGNDLYFNVSLNGATYNFTVESYLCDNTTAVYNAVKNLKIGDVIDLEGFLYWYEGVNPHITSVTSAAAVMSYADYVAAPLDSEVVVETYVQAKQSWWDNKATVYTQDENGAYFLYNMACAEEDYAKLIPGAKIRVTGYKSEWSGEVEIVDASSELLEGSYIAPAADITALLGTDELIQHQNEFVAFKGMTVAPSKDADGNDVAFLYNWDGSGQDGNDLYFNVSLDGATYNFTVESYLCDNTTEVYSAVKNLKIGDVIDLEGFLYWYEGVNPHITSVTPAA